VLFLSDVMDYVWSMNISISRKTYAQLLVWANEAGAEECCGLILGDKNNIETVEICRNVSESPEISFEIDPAALISAERRSRASRQLANNEEAKASELIGYFHSHPNGNWAPSPRDAAQGAADGRVWLLIANGQIGIWKAVMNGSIERRFEPVGLNIIPQNP